MAIDPNVPAIANAITGAVDNWNGFITDQRNWSAGTANGGVNGDGVYPLRNSLGVAINLPSPAAMAASVTGPAGAIVLIQTDVTTSKNLVLSAANAVAANLTLSNSAVVLANNAAATATTQAASASTSANTATTQATLSGTYRTQAQANATAAAGSATAANNALASAQTLNTTVQASLVTANASVQQARSDAANSAALAAASAASVNPSVIYGAIGSNVATLNGSISLKADSTSVDTRIAANVATLNTSINSKLTASSYTAADVLAKVLTVDGTGSGLDADTVDGIQAANLFQINRGTATNAFVDSTNTFGFDCQAGNGNFNLTAGIKHNSTVIAGGTGYVYTGTRGAAQLTWADNTFGFQLGNKASGGGQVAGEVAVMTTVLAITNAVANFGVQPQFNGVNLATATDLSTGLATKQASLGYTPANLAGATFSGGVTFNTGSTMNGLTMQTGGIMFNAGPTNEQTITWKMADRNVYLYGNANQVGAYDSVGGAVWSYDKSWFNVGKFAHLTSSAQVSGNLTVTGTLSGQNSLQLGNGIATGVYGDGGNVAIRGYSSGLIYLQNAGGSTSYATFGASAANVYTPLTVIGNINATGSTFVGAAGGLFVTGQNHRLVFDGSGGTRVTYRSDHATAAGVNLTTSGGSLSGVLYSDGSGANFGFLNPSNAWRLRVTSTDLYVGDAGQAAWHGGNLVPMTTNTQQSVGYSAWKGFESYAGGDPFAAASGGDINALEVYSDSNRPAVMTFHRHGQYAAYFGMDSDNRWKVGGWSDGAGVKRQFWLHNQIPTGIWQNTDDGLARFLFNGSGETYIRSAGSTAGITFLNGGGSTMLSVTSAGNLTVAGEISTPGWIRIGTSNGIYWQSYGGGWNMSDTSWMRSYSDKGIYTGGTMLAGAMQAGTITATSDARFKSNIRDLEPVAGLVPRRFVKDGVERLGYIAQEVRAAGASEAVHDQFGVDGAHYLAVEPMAMLAAVHAQLSAEIADLRARL